MSVNKLANGKYQVRFRDESKRQRAKSFARKKMLRHLRLK
jgi:hypothetical protein